jgi:inorganic pyrophosphatase
LCGFARDARATGDDAAQQAISYPLPDSAPRRAAVYPLAKERAMGLGLVDAGRDVPSEVNVIIEIPKDAEPVKYEVDKASGAMFVDRILSTPMRYPCNYGYVPRTLSGDGDPVDVMVILPLPLVTGCVVRCRPVGVLQMTDEAGSDEKILAVPVGKIFAGYAHIEDIGQVSPHWLERIGHFFEHYKDLEKGKWVRVDGWGDAAAARREILESQRRYEAAPVHQKPPAR